MDSRALLSPGSGGQRAVPPRDRPAWLPSRGPGEEAPRPRQPQSPSLHRGRRGRDPAAPPPPSPAHHARHHAQGRGRYREAPANGNKESSQGRFWEQPNGSVCVGNGCGFSSRTDSRRLHLPSRLPGEAEARALPSRRPAPRRCGGRRWCRGKGCGGGRGVRPWWGPGRGGKRAQGDHSRRCARPGLLPAVTRVGREGGGRVPPTRPGPQRPPCCRRRRPPPPSGDLGAWAPHSSPLCWEKRWSG